MGAGVFGFEADLAYTPTFFDMTSADNNAAFSSDNVTTAMANLIVGIPVGGQHGHGIRPYVAGGLGMMKEHVRTRVRCSTSVKTTSASISAARDGVRQRARRPARRRPLLSRLQNPDNSGGFTIATGNFDFWRGTAASRSAGRTTRSERSSRSSERPERSERSE